MGINELRTELGFGDYNTGMERRLVRSWSVVALEEYNLLNLHWLKRQQRVGEGKLTLYSRLKGQQRKRKLFMVAAN